MGNSDTLRNMLIAAGVFFLVLWVLPTVLPPPQEQQPAPAGERAVGSDGQPIDTGGAQPGSTAARSVTGDATGGSAAEPSAQPALSGAQSAFVVIEAEQEQTLAMGSGPANGIDESALPSPYRMRLMLSNVGASVESATMTDHAESLGSDERYILLSTIELDDGRRFRSFAVEQIIVDDVSLTLHDKRWHAEPVTETQDGQNAVFWIEIYGNDAPALKLTRTFTLPRQDKGSGRHDLGSDITVENLSDQPHGVIVTYGGGLGIRQVNPRMDDRCIDWGIFDGARVSGNRDGQQEVTKNGGKLMPLYKASAAEPNVKLCWAATANTYFTFTIAPLNRDRSDNATYITEVSALDADGDALNDTGVTLRFATAGESVGAGETLDYPADVYLGEKDGHAFHNVPKYQARNYYYQISKGFGICTFTWLVELMIWLLNSLYWLVRDFGFAIIILVLIVRALLHPITKKGQVNMVKMQQNMGELAPKMEEIKKKYANDKNRLQQETMKLYREKGINPGTQLLTCLPMFLQLPIWVALWMSLSTNVLMRHEPAFWGWTWIDDLTAPDALYTFSSPIHVPFFGWELPAFNLLPILLAVFMYLQQKLQPKPKPNPNASDQQRQQQEMMQKMMPLMSIMMLVLFYKAPSGLTLYIMSSSFLGMIEQQRIRKHIKERETAGTFHKVDRKEIPGPTTRKPPGKMSFLQKLQKMAEDAQKTKARRPAKGKPRR